VNCKSRSGAPGRSRRTLDKDNVDEQGNVKFDWWKLLSLLWPHKWLLSAAVVAAVVVAVLNIYIPLTLGALVNVIAGFQGGRPVGEYFQELLHPGLTLACNYLAQGLFTSIYIALLSVVGERVALDLRNRLFTTLVEQDISFYDTHRTGELVSRLTADVQDFKSSFKMCISQGLRSVTQTVGGVISLYIISPQMTSVIAVGLPLMIGVGTLIGSGLRKLSRNAQEQVAMATAVADEALGNIRTVRAFAMEDKEMSLYAQELEKSCWLNECLGYGIAAFQGLSNIAINGVVLAVVSQGGLLLATNQISPGNLMSFLAATQTIQRSLGNISVLFGQTVKGMSAGARVFEYIDLRPLIPLKGGVVVPHDKLRGKVEFNNVTFEYPCRPGQTVLDDFSLSVPPGKMTALCGLSGAGKSTIAVLTERFYDVNSGEITIDSLPIKSLDPSWLRGEVIGFINQEPVLFATSVRENIRYGRPSATDQEVYEAARLANAHDFIGKFPKGYETVVGERGHSVSGGQKQRIAIARALLKDPKILILDEATSALDAESEHLVQEALDRVSTGRTVIVIAHRLSTIQNADNIAVLVKGRVVESGKHLDLLKKRGVYAELIRRQTTDSS
jgi:ATP-binding cassette subfamily B (MDR/TAP) protein 8